MRYGVILERARVVELFSGEEELLLVRRHAPKILAQLFDGGERSSRLDVERQLEAWSERAGKTDKVSEPQRGLWSPAAQERRTRARTRDVLDVDLHCGA